MGGWLVEPMVDASKKNLNATLDPKPSMNLLLQQASDLLRRYSILSYYIF